MYSINDRQFSRLDPTLRRDTLEVWKEAVEFINRINGVAVTMPDDAKRGLKNKILASSVRIADRVAKASCSRSQSTLESCLRNAVEAVHETIAQLYIAKQWNYVTADYFQEMFEEGRGMVEKLCLFGGFEYLRREAN
ncbi:MAG: four helix bundle protein [Candidatus Omnitrophica bacterium]|nr:four helix bundle protein [Candidatus Omnitrophota bacterium]